MRKRAADRERNEMHDQCIIRSTLPFGRISADFRFDASHHSIYSKEKGNDTKGSADHAHLPGIWHDYGGIRVSSLFVKQH